MTYTVKPGDTLYGISNQFGVSVTELAELNNIKGSILQIGQVLTIPSNEGINPNDMFMYTVKKGDSLYSIAKKYNTTVNDIVNLNYLKSTNLSIGQVLRIPETYTPEEELVLPSFLNYVVSKGDSLYGIAKKFNISVDTIKKDNALTNNTLQIGQNLKIRIPQSNIEIEECIGPDYTPPKENIETTTTYTVKKGDSLYSIAKKFNTTVDSIKRKNNLTSNTLQIGQKLNI